MSAHSRVNNFDRLPVETIAAALSHIPSDDRDTWVTMAMAVKAELGDAGFSIWDEWSQSGGSYNERDARDVWKSVKQSGRIGIGSLIYLAQENGYNHGNRPHVISEEELAERRRKREHEQKAEQRRLEQRQSRAADDAQAMFDAGTTEGVELHPYVTRKQITVTGQVRIGTYSRWYNGEEIAIEGALLIPIRDAERRMISLQAIFPSSDNPLGRDRDYLPGGLKTGGYFPIGTASPKSETVIIAEGYATGARIHQATKYPVLIAFDAGNLPNVAKVAREKLPNARIVIAADNDAWHADGKNPGVKKAAEASLLVSGIVAVPRFSDTSEQPTDFDDLARLDGEAAVAAQIEQALNPKSSQAPEPANDNVPALPAPGARYDLAAVDWYSPLPDCNSKGKPLSTIENLQEICRRLSVNVRYNVISKEIEILIPNEGFSVDNEANASLAWLLSCCARYSMPQGQIGDFLCYLADRNPYNPVANWITSKPWDGIGRLSDLIATIKVEDEDTNHDAAMLKAAMLRRWMLSAVAAAFNPNGVSAHGVLVLQGDQYLGKTAWFKSLVPASLGVIQDGLMLRPDDRDSVKQAVSYWMVELGELDATFRKSDIAQLKAFLTRDRDTLRRAYARLESNYARRTVFFASVNPRQFLHDPTGNRRYWTLSCQSINHQHGLDMQQVWAEVYATMYQVGDTWYLTPDEMAALNAHNKDYEVLDPIRERIASKLDWEAPQINWRWITATDLLAELGYDKPTKADVTHAGQITLEMNGRQHRKSNGKRMTLVPPKIYS